MASQQSRSAALLISVYVDADGGAPWYVRLQAFDDPAAADFLVERIADKAQLLLAVRRWLESVLPDK
jgi:hypothetical protein